MIIRVIRAESTGDFVKQWQIFLRGQGYLLNSTGVFDAATVLSTKDFQKKYKLTVDGVAGNQTLGKAATLGLELVNFSELEEEYPRRPELPPLAGNAERQNIFGLLEFESASTLKNPERIRITNGWDINNISHFVIPQLRGIKGANSEGYVYFHRKAERQLRGLWQAIENRGLLPLVLSYSGDYVPRFVRGMADKRVLSNHAFGTAFDINYAWNKLGAEPATFGATGCVYPLVPIAHEFGFYWGGHFKRRDGMHFEVAKIMA